MSCSNHSVGNSRRSERVLVDRRNREAAKAQGQALERPLSVAL